MRSCALRMKGRQRVPRLRACTPAAGVAPALRTCLPAEKQTQYNLRQRAFLQLHLLLGAAVGSAPLPCRLRGAGGAPNIPAIVPSVYSFKHVYWPAIICSLGLAGRPFTRGSCSWSALSTLAEATQLHCRLSQLQEVLRD